jgi:acetyl esterase/lipase
MASSAQQAKDLLGPEFATLAVGIDSARIDPSILPQMRVQLPGLGTTEKVTRTDHRVNGDPDVPVRVHRASTAYNPQPCVYSIHGGGFVVGSYTMDDLRFESWCVKLNLIGVSVDYRLAPETPYPGPLEDCYRGLKWTYDNADDIGIERSRIGLWGASAGGGLAAAVALLARDRGEIPVAFQFLESPMLDDRRQTPSANIEGLPVWSKEANEFGWHCYLGDAYGRDNVPEYAAPARAPDLSGLPPSFVSVGGVDGFRDEAIEYALRLSQAGVATELHVYPGAPHGYQMFAHTAVARQSERDGEDWLARVIAH